MSGLNEYLIDGLAEDDGYWRVDWYGSLTYNNGLKRFSQPCIDIFLSKLKKAPDERELNYKSATDFENQRKITLPIEYLAVLRLGDVWRKGKLVRSPKYERIEKSALIDSSTCHTIMAGSKNDSEDYYINFSHHPYHKKATNTFCEVVKLPGTADIIVVPHYVIAQTYFCRSSYVFSQLFTYGLTFDTFYDDSKSEHVPNSTSFIHLKTKVHDIAAPEVARIAWDKHANNAVKMISNNFAVQSNNEWPITLKTQFPFEGKTKLKLGGKWAPIGKTDNKAFIVFNIFSCTANYPFEGLEFFRDNPGDVNKDGYEGVKGGGKDNYRPTKPKPSGDIKLKPNEEPNNTTVINEFVEPRRTEFPDLFTKDIEKVRQGEHITPPKQYGAYQEEYINEGNVGNGTSDGNVAPVGFNVTGEKETSATKDLCYFSWKICRLELFDQLIDKLEERYVIKEVEYISVNNTYKNVDERYSCFPRTFTPKGKTSKWRYIDYFKGSSLAPSKNRGVLILKVITRQHTIYLFEIERKVIKDQNGWIEKESFATYSAVASSNHALTTYDLERILEMCAEKNGTWSVSWLKDISNFKFQTIKHPKNESIEEGAGKYIDNFINTIQNKIGNKFELKK